MIQKLHRLVHGIMISMLLFALVPINAHAASLYSLQYFINPPKASSPATSANHTITFLAPNQIASGTIVVDLTNVISGIGTVDHTDIDLIYRSAADNSLVNAVMGATPDAATWGATVNGTTKQVTLRYPTSGGVVIAARQTVTILIGTDASGGDAQLLNATTSGSKMGSIVAGSNIAPFAVSLSANPQLSTGGTVTQETPAPTSTPAPVALPVIAPPPPPPPAPVITPTPTSAPTPSPVAPLPTPEPPKTLLDKIKEVITTFVGGAPQKKEAPKEVVVIPPPPPIGSINVGIGGNVATQFFGGGNLNIAFDPKTKLSQIDRTFVDLKDTVLEVKKKLQAPSIDIATLTQVLTLVDQLEANILNSKKSGLPQGAYRESEKVRAELLTIRLSLLPSTKEVKGIETETGRVKSASASLAFQMRDKNSGIILKNEFDTYTQSLKSVFNANEKSIDKVQAALTETKKLADELRTTEPLSKNTIPGFEKNLKPLLKKLDQDLFKFTSSVVLTQGKGTVEVLKKESEALYAAAAKVSRSLEESSNVLTSFKERSGDQEKALENLTASLAALSTRVDTIRETLRGAIGAITISSQDVARGNDILLQLDERLKKIAPDQIVNTQKGQQASQEIAKSLNVSQNLLLPSTQKRIRAAKTLDRVDELLNRIITLHVPGAKNFLEQRLALQDKKESTEPRITTGQQASFRVEPTPFAKLLQRIGEAIILYKPTGKAPVGNAFIVTAETLKEEPLPSSVQGVDGPEDVNTSLVAFDPPLTMTFKYTQEDSEGIQENTIKLYSWDEIEERWDQEKGTLNTKDKTIVASIKHLSIFGLFGEPSPGFEHKALISLDTSKEGEEKYLSIQNENVNLKKTVTQESVHVQNGTFYVTPNMEVEMCIPESLFKKPVKQIMLFIASDRFPLTYKKDGKCYGNTIKVPDKKGKQAIKIKVIYTDDSVQIITLEAIVTGQLQSQVLSALSPVVGQVVEAVSAVNEQVKTTVQTTQPVLQTAAVATAPAVMAANPAVLSNSLNWYHYFNHFFSWLFSLFGLKRRKRRSWGVVYDATSKTPLDLAITRLFDSKTNRLLETQVTDKNGRFSFLVSPGEYTLNITKPPFVFPSQIVSGNTDGEYLNLYRGGTITIRSEQDVINISIPLDPPIRDTVHGSGILKSTNSFLLHHSLGMLGLSFFISLLLTFYTPHTLNILLLGANALFIFWQWMIFARKEKPWGIVFDSQTLEPVSLAAIAIIDAKEKKLVKTRLTDYFGRFNFFTPPGSYIISVSKDTYLFPPQKDITHSKYKNVYLGGVITVKKKRGIAKVNVPLEKKPEQNILEPVTQIPASPQVQTVPLEDISSPPQST